MEIRHLLYIDDDVDDYEIFDEVVKDLYPHATISWLPDCSDLTHYLDTHSTPDIIFMDIYLPKINGEECLSVIRAHQRYNKVPVVFYTGSEQQNFERILTREHIYFIRKANSFAELKIELKKFFARSSWEMK